MRAGLIIGGVFLLIIGFFLTMTLIGIVIGAPIGLIGFIMILVGLFTSGGGQSKIIVQQHVNQGAASQATGSDDSLNILKRRLAKGDITKKEYNELKKELE